ncbi:MAG: lysophospholipid acyltransferase family protein [Bacilli bacterium]|nr:lysophospholipid acyltransferase family protein [Bacilli bacterium]MDD4808516.1 lysophospholipid acyltransferase family protein [Bacilli bacterium]
MFKPLITFLMKVIYRPKIVGVHHISKKGPVILAGNHTHNFDSLLLLSSTKRNIRFLGKDTLFKGIKGYFFKSAGVIPVNRRIKDKSVIPSGIKVLEENGVIGIFPEGTINRTDNVIMPFKIGAVKMGYETKASTVPFVISGDYKIFGSKLKIKFMEPFKVNSSDLDKENKKLMKIIEEELKR